MNNLNDHVKKAALKKGLYAAFSPHGSIVDIVATRTKEQRGQAWVAFADVASAAAAMRALQGFPFYDKPMRLAYAREKSHAVQKLEGSFRPVPPEERERKKRRREEEGAKASGAQEPSTATSARPPAMPPVKASSSTSAAEAQRRDAAADSAR